jgi:neutral ceramidase
VISSIRPRGESSKSWDVLELANDYIGYIPDRRAFELGGYQVWTGLHSFLEPGTGEAIVAESIKLLDQLHTVPQETVP